MSRTHRALAPTSRRDGRAAARKRTDVRDADRAMAATLAEIEARWLEAEAAWEAELPRLREQWERGIDPDLELAAMTVPGATILYLTRDDNDPRPDDGTDTGD